MGCTNMKMRKGVKPILVIRFKNKWGLLIRLVLRNNRADSAFKKRRALMLVYKMRAVRVASTTSKSTSYMMLGRDARCKRGIANNTFVRDSDKCFNSLNTMKLVP